MIFESLNAALSVKNVKMSQSSNFVVVGLCACATGTEAPTSPRNLQMGFPKKRKKKFVCNSVHLTVIFFVNDLRVWVQGFAPRP